MSSYPKTLSKFLFHFLKKEWRGFTFMQLCCFAWTLDATLWPYVMKLVIDKITAMGNDRADMWSILAPTLIFAAILWMCVEIGFRLSGFLSARLMPRLEATIRTSMFNYVQHHSYTFFTNRLAGSIANKISDMVYGINVIVLRVTQMWIPALLAVLISVALFISVSPTFGLGLLSWIIIHFSVCTITAKRATDLADLHGEARSALQGKIVDNFSNQTTVKLFSKSQFESSLIQRYQIDEMKSNKAALTYVEKVRLFLGSFGTLCLMALNVYMFVCWQREEITTGDVVFIFNTIWNIGMMVWHVGMSLPEVFREVGHCRQALNIIQAERDVVDAKEAKRLAVPKGEITFDRVTFHYNKNHTLFRDKSITIEAGKKTGIVGFSGSGKTTFVQLILRFYDPETGTIRIDGQNIATVTQESLRENIAMIPQEASLFHRTLLENLTYGKPEASFEEVVQAAKKAHAHEFIEKLSEGYNTLVGERGLKLSGGQRQRIAIARAILKDAPILILDEATSALDSVTEKYIQEGLQYLMKERTTIVIAHRLSTLSYMDRIIVFSEGKVVEDGTHNELIVKGGHYAKMWAMQAEGFLPDSGE